MASLLCCAACEAGTCTCSLVKCLLTDGKMGKKGAAAMYLTIFIIMSFEAFVLQFATTSGLAQWGKNQILSCDT